VDIAGPGGVDTRIQRDVFGKPETITRSGPGVSVTRHYVYDGDQRLCKQVEPETRASVFGYDAAGNLAWSAAGLSLSAARSCDREWVGAADKTVRHYDAMNRLTLVDFPDATVDIASSYTPDGRVATLGAGPHVWTYTYNRLRLPTRERLDHTYQGTVYPYTTDWTYTALGHRASMVAGNGLSVAYAPNALGQPTRAGSFATNVTYFPDGQLKGFTYGNGAVRSIEQNTRRLPSRIADIRSGVTILDDRFSWDANGNLTNQDDQLNLAGGDRSLSYDARDRLLSAQIGGVPTETFTYDALDNLTSRQWGGQLSRYHYNAEGQLASITGLNAQSFSYDVRGNQSGRGGRAQVFDRANRLLSVSGAGGASYEYDGHGRRTMSWRPNGTGKMDVYTQDGVLRYTSDSALGGATVYVHLGRQLVAERFARWDGSQEAITYVHGDLVGSSVVRTTASGAILEHERSYSYGQAIDGGKREAPGFTGHMEDPGTGLVYMQQRYYDPAIGRFLSVDPVGPLEDPIQNFGRYHYAYNNPYRYTDPDGRCPICPVLWAIGVGGSVGAGTNVVAQKVLNPDAPINKVEVAVSAVAGSVSGGTGGALVSAVARGGAMTVPRAIAAQTAVNAATGGGAVVAQGSIEGAPVSGKQIAIGTVGSAVGGLVPSAAGVAAGDFAAAAKQGLLTRMASSSAPGSPNIASTTLSTGNAVAQQSSMQAMGSQTGQAVAGVAAAVQQKKIEEKLK
jgi:RHS repeat-associated protein